MCAPCMVCVIGSQLLQCSRSGGKIGNGGGGRRPAVALHLSLSIYASVSPSIYDKLTSNLWGANGQTQFTPFTFLSAPRADVESLSSLSCPAARQELWPPVRTVSAGQTVAAVFIQPGRSVTSLLSRRVYEPRESCVCSGAALLFLSVCFVFSPHCVWPPCPPSPGSLHPAGLFMCFAADQIPANPPWRVGLSFMKWGSGRWGGERYVRCPTCFKLWIFIHRKGPKGGCQQEIQSRAFIYLFIFQRFSA